MYLIWNLTLEVNKIFMTCQKIVNNQCHYGAFNNKTEKSLRSKGNHQQNEKATYQTGEDI